MVTLVQQHQQVPDSNRCQKDQERPNGIVVIPVEGRDAEGNNNGNSCRSPETVQQKESSNAVVLSGGNGSLGDSSSTQCSDIEDDEEEEDEEDEEDEETEDESGEWVADLPVAAAVIQQHQQVSTANGDLVLPNADPSSFGDVCVKNSTNVHLGNKTFYKGPVTIKQFVYTNPTSALGQETLKCDNARISDANASDISTSKGDVSANRPILSPNPDIDKEWRYIPLCKFHKNLDNFEAEEREQEGKKFGSRVAQWLWTWRCAALSCSIALILVTAMVLSSVLLTRGSTTSPDPVFPEIPDSSLTGVIVSNVRFVERNEWGAQPPSEPLKKLKLPVPYVIISHTVTDFCTTQSECTFHVRFAQTFHIESRGWADIAYNFLVGGDGLAYVGRSWDYVGAHSFGYNNRSIGISFIGTFNSVKPPKAQLHAAQRIIELGVEAGKIDPNYKLLGHRQISKTLSPGDALYSIIKTWPHWSPTP